MSLNKKKILELLKQHISPSARRVPKGWEIIAEEAHRQGVVDGRAIQFERSGQDAYIASGQVRGMGMTDDQKEEIYRLAFNYRNAFTDGAQAAFDELEAFIESMQHVESRATPPQASGQGAKQEAVYQERAALNSNVWFDVSIVDYRLRLDTDGPDWVRIVYATPPQASADEVRIEHASLKTIQSILTDSNTSHLAVRVNRALLFIDSILAAERAADEGGRS